MYKKILRLYTDGIVSGNKSTVSAINTLLTEIHSDEQDKLRTRARIFRRDAVVENMGEDEGLTDDEVKHTISKLIYLGKQVGEPYLVEVMSSLIEGMDVAEYKGLWN